MQGEITNRLGTESIGKLLWKLSIPAITAQLVNVLYNIVDRAYIGNIPEIGSQAMAGLGITTPIILLITAFSSLVGMGGAPLASIKLGAKDDEGAQRILNNCFAMLIMLAVVLTALAEIFAQPLLKTFGASEATLPYALEYMRIYTAGTIFVMITLGMNSFINCQGFSGVGMWTVIIGAALNIALDPVFIFVLDMGVRGAALATILSQCVSCVWVLIFLTGKKTRIRLQPAMMKLQKEIVGKVVGLGVSPFVMQSTESLVQIVLNTGLARYSGDMAVASMTIINSVMMVLNLPLQGLGQGAQPIISYNYGARNAQRVKSAVRLLFVSLFSFIFVCWALVELFPATVIKIFNNQPELLETATWALRLYLAGMFGFGLQSAAQQVFMSTGKARQSLFVAILRKVILLIPLIYILPNFFENKVFAVFLAEPVADLISITSCTILFLTSFRKDMARLAHEDAAS